ncbi:hypothetical protein TNCV_4722551 [Trichonephila clavipes]|uniref:Uncharacterized protein n=1 Tax=Trichonephila clavipes TaxID=2585209 RepID=A0A8X6W6X2_TRICX|nr:hypothetical protein TNCV_4722551 [Trichonephila clavipes]
MVWTISLEEFLINGSILQGSKDLRLSNLIVNSERTQFGSFLLRVPSGAPHSKKPTKEYLFQLELLQPCSKKKEDPVTLRQKGLETIAILSQDNFAIAYTDGSSDRSSAMEVPESSYSSQMVITTNTKLTQA